MAPTAPPALRTGRVSAVVCAVIVSGSLHGLSHPGASARSPAVTAPPLAADVTGVIPHPAGLTSRCR